MHLPVMQARGWSGAALLLAGIFLAGPMPTPAAERFPPPEFESHTLPESQHPPPDGTWREILDVGVLVAALGVASYLSLKSRSRRGLLIMTLFAVAYFGFWRKGCICPIGAIQNVALALFHPEYALPLSVLAFFLIPLVFTLFWGRGFCAGVCPLGAIQDLVVVRPVRVPRWLEHGLRFVPYVYLGLAVLFAATASAFVICEYDPFVAFFRLSGSWSLLLLGAVFLVAGMFLGRPYCRFLCPYGVILGMTSRCSKHGVTITPDSCVRCRLCENECPFGAIEAPEPEGSSAAEERKGGAVMLLLLLLPLLILVGGWVGHRVAEPLSRMHWNVRLAERLVLEETGRAEGTTEESAAFRATGMPVSDLYADALSVQDAYSLGATVLGALLGLVVGIKLLQTVVRRRRKDYEVNRSWCLSCGRCFYYCPQEHERLKSRGVTIQPADVSRQL